MVSIIILSYNTKSLLYSCLSSLYEHLHGFDFEVIVFDNASSDHSVQMVQKEFAKANVVESKENFGFAKGNNLGAQQARGDYLIFLNSDTKVLDNSIKDMIAVMTKDEAIGVMGGRLASQEGVSEPSFGKSLSILGILLMLFGKKGFRLNTQYDTPTQVDWVSGGFMLTRKDLFDKLGGFDEHFFMYIEDMEFCYRVKKLGYAVYYYPNTKVVHLGQGSSNRTFAIIHIYKGLPYFFRKHKGYFQYLLVMTLLRLKAMIAILIGTITKNAYLATTYKQAIRF